MINEQILKKAIEKAVKGGYSPVMYGTLPKIDHPCEIIFSHSFAKAFWGEKVAWNMDTDKYNPGWQYHLTKMVLEPEPLKYLEKFL